MEVEKGVGGGKVAVEKGEEEEEESMDMAMNVQGKSIDRL